MYGGFHRNPVEDSTGVMWRILSESCEGLHRNLVDYFTGTSWGYHRDLVEYSVETLWMHPPESRGLCIQKPGENPSKIVWRIQLKSREVFHGNPMELRPEFCKGFHHNVVELHLSETPG